MTVEFAVVKNSHMRISKFEVTKVLGVANVLFTLSHKHNTTVTPFQILRCTNPILQITN